LFREMMTETPVLVYSKFIQH